MSEPEAAAGDRDPGFDPAPELAGRVEAGDAGGAVALARALHPAQLASALTGIDHDVRELLVRSLDPRELGASLAYLRPHDRQDLLTGLAPGRVAAVLRGLADNVSADVVRELPEAIGRQVLAVLPLRQRHAVDHILHHDEESAGGRMTGQHVALARGRTAGEAIDELRFRRPDAGQPFYLYVTDGDGRVDGVVNFRSLLTAPPDTPIEDIASGEVVAVTADTDQEEAARLLNRYKLLSLPVVDGDGHLLGAVTANDLIDVLEDEATEDMFRQAGVHEDEDLRSVPRSVRYRLPWLLVNLGTVLLAAFVVAAFESTVARVAVLAAFLPVVAGQGGNAGIQTLTVVIRSLAIGRLSGRNLWQVVLHEVATGAINGLAVGGAIALFAWLWQGSAALGLIAGIALFANMLVGVLAGVLIPMGLQRFRQDPALSAGIWLTTATDVIGFAVFLGLAALLVDALA